MRIIETDGRRTVMASTYRLRLGDGPDVELSDAAGRPWSRLSLLADVDRVDRADESFGVGRPDLTEAGDAVEVTLTAHSTAWRHRSVVLRCFDDHLELQVVAEGSGTLDTVRLLGGRAVLPNGATGTFRSSIGFASVFAPTPTEPVQVVRPAFAAATLGVSGDAAPGRLHAVFSPPPLCLALGRAEAAHATDIPTGDWLSVGVVAAVEDMRFTELRYLPVDGGFLLELDYDGHTVVAEGFRGPVVVLRPVAGPAEALTAHRADLVDRGLAPAAPAAPVAAAAGGPAWWREPLFCGWGAQCARAAWPQEGDAPGAGAPDLARQDRYDEWLARLAAHEVVPGTVVIDDRWQADYGTGEPDRTRWPDLGGWIRDRHAAGQRVLLWWKAWAPEGLPDDECVVDPLGVPVAADPGSPAYREHLRAIVARLLGPDGLDADGFKIDFTQRAPTGRALRRPGAPEDAPWGIAALYTLLRTIHTAAKAVKADALIVTHTPHPGFADVTDMIRLNDVLERDPRGAVVPAADQLAFRHMVVSRTMPGHLVDTDQWPILDRAAWRAYVTAQARLGVPALYYAERVDNSGEELTGADLALVARTWREYRDSLR